MKRIAMILFALMVGMALDGAVAASNGAAGVSSAPHKQSISNLSAQHTAQLECARRHNFDLKLPTVPSVDAPRRIEQSSRDENPTERLRIFGSETRAAGAGKDYISTKPLSRLFVGRTPSGYGIRMLCRLII